MVAKNPVDEVDVYDLFTQDPEMIARDEDTMRRVIEDLREKRVQFMENEAKGKPTRAAPKKKKVAIDQPIQ